MWISHEGGFTMAPIAQYSNEWTALTDKIMVALAAYGFEPSQSYVESFTKQLIECQIKESRYRKALQSRQHGVASRTMDIYYFLKDARDSGRMDEALWCAFLTTH